MPKKQNNPASRTSNLGYNQAGLNTRSSGGEGKLLEKNNVRVLALIPAYNEGRHVAAVVRAALAHLPVLVVDDGSTDDTAANAQSAGAEVLLQKPNQGKGSALLTGFNYALQNDYDAVLTLDADGQHDPAEIPVFLEAFAANQADLIIGQRDFTKMPPVRRFSNTLGTLIFSWALGQHVNDNQSGYRLISRRLMEVMHEPQERGFEFEVEMILKCVLNDFKLAWVPIRTIYANEKSHISPLRHLIKFFQVSFRARRMRIDLQKTR
jgi:glycosyltransferase involved in cell wall biosynthesis